MMMKDLREVPMPPAEMGSTSKIVALAIALVFGAIGAYSYETGTWNSQPKQIVASKEVPPPAPLGNAAPSEAAPPALADLPPAPVKNVPAQTSTQAAAAPPPVRVARAQTPAPALPQASAAPPTESVSAPASPEIAAPATSIPEQPASPPVNTPSQEAPAPEAPQQ
jgi:periplasmic protein TonB